MILINVDDNPNCKGVPQMSYAEMEPPKEVAKIRLEKGGKNLDCWVTGINEGGSLCPVYSQKVVDSGAAYAYVVYGGEWGIRFQTENPAMHPWDMSNPAQWGEPYLLLGEESDLSFQ